MPLAHTRGGRVEKTQRNEKREKRGNQKDSADVHGALLDIESLEGWG